MGREVDAAFDWLVEADRRHHQFVGGYPSVFCRRSRLIIVASVNDIGKPELEVFRESDAVKAYGVALMLVKEGHHDDIYDAMVDSWPKREFYR